MAGVAVGLAICFVKFGLPQIKQFDFNSIELPDFSSLHTSAGVKLEVRVKLSQKDPRLTLEKLAVLFNPSENTTELQFARANRKLIGEEIYIEGVVYDVDSNYDLQVETGVPTDPSWPTSSIVSLDFGISYMSKLEALNKGERIKATCEYRDYVGGLYKIPLLEKCELL